jgi:hypothetical protein
LKIWAHVAAAKRQRTKVSASFSKEALSFVFKKGN